MCRCKGLVERPTRNMLVYRDHGDIGRQGQDSFSNKWETLNIITSTAHVVCILNLHFTLLTSLFYIIKFTATWQHSFWPFTHLFYSKLQRENAQRNFNWNKEVRTHAKSHYFELIFLSSKETTMYYVGAMGKSSIGR